MGKENIQFNQRTLPDFSQRIPDKLEVERIGTQVIANREKLLSQAEDWGLDYDFLVYRQSEFMVGPFVYPTPLPTTYGGKLDNFVTATKTTEAVAGQLREQGINAKPYTVLSLGITEIPTSGLEDSLVLPKNAQTKQKIAIPERTRGLAYGFSKVKNTTITELKKTVGDSYNQYADMYWQLKQKRRGRVILESIQNDIDTAFDIARRDKDSVDDASYITFANAFNGLIANRVFPNSSADFSCIDTAVYSPFIKEGIRDIGVFFSKLDSYNFFANNPNVIKFVNQNRRTNVYKVRSYEKGDAVFVNDYDGQTVSYQELLEDGVSVAPTKELSYFLCFANMVPVVYGSQNNGSGYYQPYAVARQQVEQAGFNPILYRIQPPISTNYQELNSIFDFYREILLPDLTL